MANDQLPTTIRVQLCYALPNAAPTVLELCIDQHSTIDSALNYLDPSHQTEVQFLLNKGSAWAIFGKKKSGAYLLQNSDRIELCRPLIADPMSARRHRAKREHKSGKM